MEDGLIPDRSIEASSVFASQYTESLSRLNTQATAVLKGCWAPATNEKDQYVQVGQPVYQVALEGLTEGLTGFSQNTTKAYFSALTLQPMTISAAKVA